ncbi:ubiquitin carboxyl-terminal hydrolase isozyme L3-like [Sycon ciliatum]|uniref:ubiquitin carboxyl-terminal hydrolase isozyme L3-like n=1 Tax=Sycon ciliatum TaxID=27933 RepID=UPI0031F62421
MVPQPVCALIVLFPCSQKYHDYTVGEVERLEKEGQHVDDSVFFMRQTIGNACGTIGLLHSISNSKDRVDLEEGYLTNFISHTKDMTPAERGSYLEGDDTISAAHEESANEGQSEVPSDRDSVNLHFVALVPHKDSLYELDGRKPFPVNHGPTTLDTFLQDGALVCQKFMARDPSELHFTILALAHV